VTATDPFSRRGVIRHVAIGTAIVIGTLGILAAIIYIGFLRGNSATGLLTDHQFSALKLGQTRSSVERAIGPSSKDPNVSQPSQLPTGMTCMYYVEANSQMDFSSYYRLCYSKDMLSSKVKYASPYGPADQPSLEPSMPSPS
jgi:hypothetical protein